VVQGEHLDVLDEDAAVAVHDRLRQAGGAGRVEDVQRVVERDGLEGERLVGSLLKVVLIAFVQVCEFDDVLE
jgi:hypothetical protein